MTYVDLKLKVTLPEDLARNAEAAGLLESAELERLLRAEMRRAAYERIVEGVGHVREAGIPEMSPMEIQEIVNEVRAERRAKTKQAG